MKKLILISLFLLVPIILFGQSNSRYKKIRNVEYFYTSLDASLSDTLKLEEWETYSKLKKEKVKKYILKKEKEVLNDTSKFTQLLYYGKKESIEIQIGDSISFSKELKEQSKKYFWAVNDHPNQRKTFEIKSIKRNIGIQKITIHFKNINRTVSFNVDTSYSQVFIVPEIEIKLIRLKGKKTKKGLPRPAKQKLKKTGDRISIDHRVPRIYSR